MCSVEEGIMEGNIAPSPDWKVWKLHLRFENLIEDI